MVLLPPHGLPDVGSVHINDARLIQDFERPGRYARSTRLTVGLTACPADDPMLENRPADSGRDICRACGIQRRFEVCWRLYPEGWQKLTGPQETCMQVLLNLRQAALRMEGAESLTGAAARSASAQPADPAAVSASSPTAWFAAQHVCKLRGRGRGSR